MSLEHLRVLSDLVHDSRLETEIFTNYIKHVFYVSGWSARERHVRKEERWVRDQFLGQGAYGVVYRERCDQDENNIKLRAVKQIRKFAVPGKELDYTRELEAIIKFSNPRVRNSGKKFQ
jgi:hypothetical protein